MTVALGLDGTGAGRFDTGVPFLEHMLDQVARHGLFDLEVTCEGDLEIDDHHTVEDIGITLGQAFAEALGERRGIRRYGHAYVPLDESAVAGGDRFLGSTGACIFTHDFTRTTGRHASMSTLASEFFPGVREPRARHGLHLDVLHGANDHHRIETLYKAFGRALRNACEIDERASDAMPSTKGSL